MKITCFPPVEMMISSGAYSNPLSRKNFPATASRSTRVPATSVYFVSPARIARMAASLTLSGVSKSGSPADNEITSRPAAFKARALEEIAIVWLGLILSRRAAVRGMRGCVQFWEGDTDISRRGVVGATGPASVRLRHGRQPIYPEPFFST